MKFNYTNHLIENTFAGIDSSKEELLRCTDDFDIETCRMCIEQYEEFLSRILVK